MDNTQRHASPHLLPIGSFAQAAGLSLKALRLYDRLGILRPAHIAPDSGYRYYRAEQLPAARRIRLMRQMDMPLATIRQAVEADAEQVGVLIRRYLTEQEARVTQARSMARMLLRDAQNEETHMNYVVEVKNAGAQPVVSITRSVKIDGLVSHIARSLAELRAFVQEQSGELAGPPFGIFHGPVNENDDGPMEVCWPAQGKFTPVGSIVMKELPGGRTACVEAKGEQCRFPAILEAYDAGSDWVARNGYDLAGPPREIWLDDRGDHMMIAWPFEDKQA